MSSTKFHTVNQRTKVTRVLGKTAVNIATSTNTITLNIVRIVTALTGCWYVMGSESVAVHTLAMMAKLVENNPGILICSIFYEP